MPQRIVPSALKAQASTALMPGQTQATHGEALLSTLVQLATALAKTSEPLQGLIVVRFVGGMAQRDVAAA
jgi:hypothetical protein